MQRLILAYFMAVIIISCRKEIKVVQQQDEYASLRVQLKQQMTADDFTALDFTRVARSDLGTDTLWRVGFKEKKLDESFLLLKLDPVGLLIQGRIIQLKKDTDQSSGGKLRIKKLNGTILEETQLLNGRRQDSKITGSKVITPDPTIELPEVVVVATIKTSSPDISWSTWYNLTSLLGVGQSNTYAMADPFAGATGGSVATANSPVMTIDFEDDDRDPGITVEEYLKCFANIPDAGAVCTIGIYSDIPVDDDPAKMFNYATGSPGHAFIRIEKRNGSKYAKQYIGLYPKSGLKAGLTTGPIEGKLVNNQQHEYNAYMEVNITVPQLTAAITKIKAHAKPTYIVDRYNCADFVLTVWNAGTPMSQNIEIPKLHIPGSMYAGSNTPQGLYNKIKQLKDANHPLSKNMQVNVQGKAGYSTGPCN